MLADDFANSSHGRVVRSSRGDLTFVPESLPRELPVNARTVFLLDQASRAVAMLAGVGEALQNPHLLIAPFLRREAVLSSRIEGTQASISDVFRFEAGGKANERGDVREVSNYVAALEQGRAELSGLPLSGRLLNKLHQTLLSGVRGQETRPGAYRKEQVWIGIEGSPIEDAIYVPPAPEKIAELMADWERFVNEALELPPLMRAALMHYQFEAIHPYMDGNGRIGRLAILLFLEEQKVLETPLLYLSAFFEKERAAYYDHLLRVSQTGEWQPWLDFFLVGVAQQAQDALSRSRRLRALQDSYRATLQSRRAPGNDHRLLEAVFTHPYLTAKSASDILGITPEGARNVLDRLTQARILEYSPRSWPRLYAANELLEIIEAPNA